MREDKDAICECTHIKGDHWFYVDYCHCCGCLKFKWDNLDYLEAKVQLNEDKK
jgi:type I restriction-modification system DNA methylase subunit